MAARMPEASGRTDAPDRAASSAATRSRGAGPCSSCLRSGAAPCAGSCSPRIRTPRRSSIALRSWPVRTAGPGRDRAAGPARRAGPHRVAPGRAGAGPAARAGRAGGPGRCPTAVARHRSCWWRPASPTRRNLGALLRSAECAGVTGVVLPRHRSARLSPTVTKTAAGAIEHLPFAVVRRRARRPERAARPRGVVDRPGRRGGPVALRPAARATARSCSSSAARRRGWRRWCAAAAMRWPPSPSTARCRRSTWAWPARWPASRSPASGRPPPPCGARPPPPPPRCRTRSGAPRPGCRSGTRGTAASRAPAPRWAPGSAGASARSAAPRRRRRRPSPR